MRIVIKVALFVFNILFLLSGLLLIIVGAINHTRVKDYFNFIEGPSDISAAALLVVGVLTFVVGLFEFFALITENHCMFMSFSLFLSTIFIIEISCGVVALVNRDKLQERLTNGMNKDFGNYNSDTSLGVKIAWNKMQKENECCGVNGSVDYEVRNWVIPRSCCQMKPHNSDTSTDVKTTWNKVIKEKECCGVNGSVDYGDMDWVIPESCCQEKSHNSDTSEVKIQKERECCGVNVSVDYENRVWVIPKGKANTNVTNVNTTCELYTNGCDHTLYGVFSRIISVNVGVGIGVGLLQVIAMILTCFLARTVKEKYEDEWVC